MIKAILLLGGIGKRFECETPKQFLPLSGKKLYLYAVEAFIKSQKFEEIILVCHQDFVETVRLETESVTVISGGNTRQESSYLGLVACGPDTKYVMIHDGARPFITARIIEENLSLVKKWETIDTCIPSTDTIVYAKDKQQITSIPNREHYLRGQTPQTFSYDLIMRAHKKAMEENIKDASDDCQLALMIGSKIALAKGSEKNIKITTELDLFLAEQILRQQSQEPSGHAPISLKNKVYALSGGSGGIGQALATMLGQEGATALILSPSDPIYSVDLRCPKATKKVFQTIEKSYGELDGLINCIGHLLVKEFAKLSDEEVEELIDVNLKGLVYCCKFAKIKRGGHLINIASSSYSRGRKTYALYSAAKSAVVNFTQGLAEEMPNHFVNAIVPARTNTKMRQRNFTEEKIETLLTPEQVATKMLSFLKTNQSTGSIVEIKKHQFQPFRKL